MLLIKFSADILHRNKRYYVGSMANCNNKINSYLSVSQLN